MRATTILGVTAAAVFAILGWAFCSVSAADPTSSADVTVKYSDLNIAIPSGARVFYGRIRAAAQSACNYFWFERDADAALCLKNTIAKAVTKVNQPALTAVYNKEFKPSETPILSQSR